MAGVRTGAAWGQIQRLFGLGTVSGLSEWQLLERYADRRDDAAFAALVARHGAMVLGVCRRLLHDPDDVEDAFQATFLVLARKAGVLRPRDPLGHWLYGVAHRVSLRARSEAARRRSRERPARPGEPEAEAAVSPEAPDADLGAVIDEELRRLPASYRAAVVLCYLDGLTHEEAARQLGWPLGTVKGRLSRARGLLRDRLTRRGLALTSGALAAMLAREAGASVPTGWDDAVVKAAARVAAGEAAAGAIKASAVALAEGVIWTMLLNQWKTAAVALALLAALTAGAGALAQKDETQGPSPAPAPVTSSVPKPADAAAKPAEPPGEAVVEAVYGYGAGEPAGDPKAEAGEPVAAEGFKLALKRYGQGLVNAEAVHLWSRRMLERESDTPDPALRREAAKRHLERMGHLERMAHNHRPAADPLLDKLSARYYHQEAERLVKAGGLPAAHAGTVQNQGNGGWIADVTGPMTPPKVAVSFPDIDFTSGEGSKGAPGGTATGPLPGRDARSLAILKTLDEPVVMSFAEETPLEDVLKYIKEKTVSKEFPKGLPIYVDPMALQEVEKTMTSPVAIDLDGVSLKRTLYLVLKQLDLKYTVQDGMIYVSSLMGEEDEEEEAAFSTRVVGIPNGPSALPPAVRQPYPARVMADRFLRGELTAEERKAFLEFLKDRAEVRKLVGPAMGGGMGGMGGGMSGMANPFALNMSPEERAALLEYLKFRNEVRKYLPTPPVTPPAAANPPAAATPARGGGLQ